MIGYIHYSVYREEAISKLVVDDYGKTKNDS